MLHSVAMNNRDSTPLDLNALAAHDLHSQEILFTISQLLDKEMSFE